MKYTQVAIKKHIEETVLLYEKTCSIEFKAFTEQMKAKQQNIEHKQSGTVLDRPMIEYPETLYSVLRANLIDDEWKYLDSTDGVHWFAKRFPEFSLINNT